MNNQAARFGGVARLFSREGAERLARSHVAVVGVGGVGSWAAEALARSGIGTITLVDLDDVCATNVNRQIHALEETVGQSKVRVMAARLRSIDPAITVHAREEFFTSASADAFLQTQPDYIVDAIDEVPNKCLLIAEARRRGIPLVVCGGAGGKRDGTAVRADDLGRASNDRLLQRVRDVLRREHGFPKGETWFGIPAVFSTERPVFPHADGSVCAVRAEGTDLRLNCDSGFGTAVFVTGAFGLAAAGRVVRDLALPV